MHKLSFYSTETTDTLAHPGKQSLTVDSPAVEIFTDFNRQEPHVADIVTSVSSARNLMSKFHIHLLVVLDQRNRFAGIVTRDDLNTQEIIKKVAQGNPLEELLVSDFMQPRQQLKAFSRAEVEQCTIGDVIATLSDSGQRHCLVIDRNSHQIEGIIATSEIAARLGLPLTEHHQTRFSELYRAINPQAGQNDVLNRRYAH